MVSEVSGEGWKCTYGDGLVNPGSRRGCVRGRDEYDLGCNLNAYNGIGAVARLRYINRSIW